MVLHIRGDVLAVDAVAAGRAVDEHAVLVAQRARQAVDLRLGGEVDRLLAGKPRKRRTRATNSTTSSSEKALSSESIGTACRTLANLAAGARADPRGRRVRPDQVREAGLDLAVAAPQRVVLGVGDRSARPPGSSACHGAAISAASRLSSALACASSARRERCWEVFGLASVWAVRSRPSTPQWTFRCCLV